MSVDVAAVVVDMIFYVVIMRVIVIIMAIIIMIQFFIRGITITRNLTVIETISKTNIQTTGFTTTFILNCDK